jgi:hypothetical protein
MICICIQTTKTEESTEMGQGKRRSNTFWQDNHIKDSNLKNVAIRIYAYIHRKTNNFSILSLFVHIYTYFNSIHNGSASTIVDVNMYLLFLGVYI